MAKSLGLGELLGLARNERSIAYGLILSRAVHPLPKLATTKWWGGTTLASDLGLEDAGTGEARAAMGWLVECQVTIETSLAPRHLGKTSNPPGLACFDHSFLGGRNP